MPELEAETAVCGACGFSNPRAFRFCGQCGRSLSAPEPHSKTDGAAEYRHVTVLFCDLVGSTSLAEELDPERLRDVMRDFQAAAAVEVERFAGHVAQYLGDGLLVYFGYPRAQEDDARRALHAARAIVESVERLSQRLRKELDLDLEVRIGMHTGSVIAGELGAGARRERLALGPAPNAASRLQNLAEPGEILLSAATHRLVEGFFRCESLGEKPLRGFAEPFEVFRLVGESGVGSRFELAVAQGLVPLVGRAAEVERLESALAEASAGRGRVVLVTGEAGIGKSRLVYQFRTRDAAEKLTWRLCRCSPYHQSSAYYPLVEMMQDVLGFGPESPPEEKFARLEARFSELGFDPEATLPYLVGLFSLPLPPSYPTPNLGPQRQKERLFEIFREVLERLAEGGPVVLAIEDLHWVDPSSREMVEYLVERASEGRYLMILTARPSYEWGAVGLDETLRLEPLTRREIEALAVDVAGGRALPAPLVEQVVAKSDGVPLVVEELIRMTLDSGQLVERDGRWEIAGSMPSLDVPTTLRGSLVARLDRLGEAKELAQVLAVAGREIPAPMVHALAPSGGEALDRQLATLLDSRILFRREWGSEPAWIFKHALIRDAAYETLLKSRRAHHHRRIAEILTRDFPQTAANQPEVVARHYQEAGLARQAVEAWLRAGQRAVERSANVEAVEHLEHGRALVERLDDEDERERQELAILSALGPALGALHGYGAPQVQAAYDRALELCADQDDGAPSFPALRGLWAFYLTRADMDRTIALADRLLELAEEVEEPGPKLEAIYAAGASRCPSGEIEVARARLEEVLALGAEHPGESYLPVTEADPAVNALSFLAMVLWHAGLPDRALDCGRQAIERAREIEHAFSLGFAELFTIWIHQLRGERREAWELARELERHTEERGFALLLNGSRVHLSLGVLQGMRGGEGVSEEEVRGVLGALEGFRSTGSLIFVSLALGHLVQALLECGLVEPAGQVLGEAASLIEATGERLWDAEIRRLRGEVLRASGGGGAEGEFHRALEIARAQSNRSLELRAASSLARLWHGESHSDEAAELLAPIYDGFTEGFETADLRAAREILGELR